MHTMRIGYRATEARCRQSLESHVVMQQHLILRSNKRICKKKKKKKNQNLESDNAVRNALKHRSTICFSSNIDNSLSTLGDDDDDVVVVAADNEADLIDATNPRTTPPQTNATFARTSCNLIDQTQNTKTQKVLIYRIGMMKQSEQSIECR